ncbi:MAG: protein kinase domain-containing protein [Streptosporangiaceae bacterium]
MHVAASTGRVVAGRYLLQTTIGRGAMGTVWRARDTVLARDVAVKEVRVRGPVTTGSVMTEETRILYARTLREARTAARLNHPAVVTIFDVVEADGSPWIVMELVEARSLDQVLTEDGPLAPHRVADLGLRVLGALACAHAAGILHRDVKPSNVLLGPAGRVVLTDFGIATLEGDSGLTQAGMVMGTPGFTAPERIRGDPASPASDLWSLGATLYAAVEGRGPFDDRGNSIAILAAIANGEAPRPRQAGPLRPVIEALLHRNPQARPDAAAVGRQLAAAGTSAGNGAASAGDAPSANAFAGDAGRRPARAGAPLLTAPLNLASAGPQTQAPAGGGSGPDAPRPDGRWAGALWPDGPWPDAPSADSPWPDRPWSDRPWPESLGPEFPRPPSAAPQTPGGQPFAPWAPAPRAPAQESSAPQAGRHGVSAPGGGRGLAAELAAMLPRGRRGLLALVGALAIVGAGILLGVALTHGSSGTGATSGAAGSHAVTASQAGSPAGFSMTVPAGWQTARRGTGTAFTGPAGDVSILVTPTAAGGVTAPGQVRRQLARALQEGRFPGYEPIGGRPFAFQGGAGVAWQFTWQPASGGRMEVLEIAFRVTTPAGRQGYLVRESAPASAWTASQPEFHQALITFRARS